MCGPLSMICLNLMNHRVRCSNLWAFSGPFQRLPIDSHVNQRGPFVSDTIHSSPKASKADDKSISSSDESACIASGSS